MTEPDEHSEKAGPGWNSRGASIDIQDPRFSTKGIKKVSEIGKAGRDVRKAQTTPLDDARK